MNYFDAAIGFAVVMAVLSGAVTAAMESVWSLLRKRTGNVIGVLKQLMTELDSVDGVQLTPTQRWEVITSILNNPLKASGRSQSCLPESEHLSDVGDLKLRSVSALVHPSRWVRWLGSLVTPRNEHPADAGAIHDAAFQALGRQHSLSGMFNKVSSEHVARHFAEVFVTVNGNVEALSAHLERMVARFEALSSSMSAEFKRTSRIWSILLGILIALVFNINGLRILDTFVSNPELSKIYATELDKHEREVLESVNAAKTSLDKLATTPGDSTSAGATKELAETVEDLRSTVGGLTAKGIPIGPTYWPHCSISQSIGWIDSIDCTQTSSDQERGIISTLFMLMLTGVLIGLGAPFWFDVAKRVAAVRSAFGGTPSASERMQGRDANGSAEGRKNIVNDITTSVGEEKKMNLFKNYFNVPDASTLTFRVTDSNGGAMCRADLVDASQKVAQWTSNDIKDTDGGSQGLAAAAMFYSHTLDITFARDDTALVSLSITDSNNASLGEDWNFELKGKAGRTHSAITTILMG